MKPAIALLATLSFCCNVAASDTLYIYPAGGQSDAQLAKDRYQCYRWAVDNTGVDPNTMIMPQSGQTVVRNENAGSGAKGTLVGTLAGAALGNAVNGHTEGTVHGAIIGATLGSVIGSEKERQGSIKARQEAQAIAANRSQDKLYYRDRMNSYNRAFSACMEARNYSVR